MPPVDPPSEVTVRVKVPPGHIPITNIDEFSLGSLSTGLPVAALRQRIQTLVPSHPSPQHQRILYGGRALIDDGQSLADALNIRRDPSQTEYVLHLLIRDGGEHARSGSNTPHIAHVEQRPLQPQPIHAQPGMFPVHNHFQQIPGMVRIPSRPGSHAGQPVQDQPQPDGAHASGQPHRHFHHHHHHHHPHHHHGPVPNGAPQVPPRPVSGQDVHVEGTGPNGERFTIHQHTVNVPFGALPGVPPGLPVIPGVQLPGFPGQLPAFPLPFPMPNMAQPAQQPGVSALDRARSNMNEMRRMVDELRVQNTDTQSQQRITELEERMQAINDYIDPFRVGSTPAARPTEPRASPALPVPQPPMPHAPFGFPLPIHSPMPPQMLRPQRASPQEVSAYLLSSSEGPRAVVLTPHHGSFTGMIPTQPQAIQPTSPAPPEQPADQLAVQNAPAPDNQAPPAVAPPQLAEIRGPLDLMRPIMGHAWLLLRILIFAYFLLGSNFGWRRPVALGLIGLGFWMIRIGLFGNGGVVRRWWDDLVRIDDVRQRIVRGRLRRMGVDIDAALADAQARVQAENDAQAQADGPAAAVQAPVGDGVRPAQPFPTPEELAQRLVRRQRGHDPIRRLREQLRPVERSFALFVASLWPGVGERYVQALDQAREEEEAARREVERQQQEQAAQATESERKDDPNAQEAQAESSSEKTEAALASSEHETA